MSRAVLTAHINQFLSGNYTVGSVLGFADESPNAILATFLNGPSEALYPTVANILQAFVNKCQTIAYPSTNTYRVVATISDGTVYFDSSKGSANTWANYKAKSINENHNSRPPFMKVLLNDDQYAFEEKFSSSTGVSENRVAFRFGSSKDQPLGVIALSNTSAW